MAEGAEIRFSRVSEFADSIAKRLPIGTMPPPLQLSVAHNQPCSLRRRTPTLLLHEDRSAAPQDVAQLLVRRAWESCTEHLRDYRSCTFHLFSSLAAALCLECAPHCVERSPSNRTSWCCAVQGSCSWTVGRTVVRVSSAGVPIHTAEDRAVAARGVIRSRFTGDLQECLSEGLTTWVASCSAAEALSDLRREVARHPTVYLPNVGSALLVRVDALRRSRSPLAAVFDVCGEGVAARAAAHCDGKPATVLFASFPSFAGQMDGDDDNDSGSAESESAPECLHGPAWLALFRQALQQACTRSGVSLVLTRTPLPEGLWRSRAATGEAMLVRCDGECFDAVLESFRGILCAADILMDQSWSSPPRLAGHPCMVRASVVALGPSQLLVDMMAPEAIAAGHLRPCLLPLRCSPSAVAQVRGAVLDALISAEESAFLIPGGGMQWKMLSDFLLDDAEQKGLGAQERYFLEALSAACRHVWSKHSSPPMAQSGCTDSPVEGDAPLRDAVVVAMELVRMTLRTNHAL